MKLLTNSLRHNLSAIAVLWLVGLTSTIHAQSDPTETLTPEEWTLVRNAERERIEVVNRIIGSVVAIYGPNQQGGGSGVIIEPNGIALTNHHVIEGAGLKGKGGLSDGHLYDWDLIGTDPGGDVAIIKLKGKSPFPFSPLGDSDKVRVGDWALAMGNPFLLAHDQVPTVTLGIVSGVERFQGGAGRNQLVYGNCIQVDSSINPGNSGGPLFNMQGEVIGINGRGSFRDRGRVNVGLGYAISSNQIKNFIPDLLATKIVEHGTLDANFSDRDGHVVCSTINLDAPVALAGVELGDRLIEFEGRPITYANQFKNLICTLPEDWPASLVVEKPDGQRLSVNTRLFGLPYNFERPEPASPDDPQPAPEDDDDAPPDDSDDQDEEPSPQPPGPDRPPGRRPMSKSQIELRAYLASEAGVVLNVELNRSNLQPILLRWRSDTIRELPQPFHGLKIEDTIWEDERQVGQQTIWLAGDGRFRLEHSRADAQLIFGWDGVDFWQESAGERQSLRMIMAKTNPLITQAICLAAPFMPKPFQPYGQPLLDGTDKAQAQLAYRLMLLDEDEDWFYCWLSMYNADGRPQVRLLRASADKDCGTKSNGVVLNEWKEVSGIWLPFQKSLVTGLDEQIQWTAQTESASLLESADEDLFNLKTSDIDAR